MLDKYSKIISVNWVFYLEYLSGGFMISNYQIKKIGRFLKNTFLIKYLNITFQSGNASFITIKN